MRPSANDIRLSRDRLSGGESVTLSDIRLLDRLIEYAEGVEEIERMLDALDDEEAVELLLSAPDALPGEAIPFPCPRPDSGPPPEAA